MPEALNFETSLNLDVRNEIHFHVKDSIRATIIQVPYHIQGLLQVLADGFAGHGDGGDLQLNGCACCPCWATGPENIAACNSL